MLRAILKTTIIILSIIILKNNSFSQNTNLSIQGGIFYGNHFEYLSIQSMPSYQGTISFLYNFHDKIDLIGRMRFFSFLYSESHRSTKVFYHYGLALMTGCRFYVGEHFPKKGETIFYPYFEIFTGVMGSISKADPYTDFYESNEIIMKNNLGFMYAGFSVGSIIKCSENVNLDFCFDLTAKPALVSSSLGFVVAL